MTKEQQTKLLKEFANGADSPLHIETLRTWLIEYFKGREKALEKARNKRKPIKTDKQSEMNRERVKRFRAKQKAD